jgi:hypothetical protein
MRRADSSGLLASGLLTVADFTRLEETTCDFGTPEIVRKGFAGTVQHEFMGRRMDC